MMNEQKVNEIWSKANTQYYQAKSEHRKLELIFAELIVKECADAIELNTMQIPKRSISEIRTILDKHFGVEK